MHTHKHTHRQYKTKFRNTIKTGGFTVIHTLALRREKLEYGTQRKHSYLNYWITYVLYKSFRNFNLRWTVITIWYEI